MVEQQRRCRREAVLVLVSLNGGDQVRAGGSCCTTATTYTQEGPVWSLAVASLVLCYPGTFFADSLETEVPMRIST